MSVPFNPALAIDCYKFGHPDMIPDGMTNEMTNGTFRGSRIEGVEAVLWVGFQATINELESMWDERFFGQPVERVIQQYKRRADNMLGPDTVPTDRFRELHELGYLPLRIRSIPEGTEVPLRVPVFTIEATDPRFAWLPAYLETWISAESWFAPTSATTALRMRRMLDGWAAKTSDTPEAVDFQAHDFSYRGHTSTASAMKSGMGHLTCFAGTDTVPAIDFIEWHYSPLESSVIGVSVPATEHSTMCAGGKETEADTYDRLMFVKYPRGILSIVSDTWDYFKVLRTIIAERKDQIMERDGKVVIRPDSGDPVEILCGTVETGGETDQELGTIEILWDIFGGTINSKGYKVLDPHIGAIYGDSITYERADEICRRLEKRGFASTNVVFGVGSFTYQYVTRDTHGFAMKATWAEIDGESVSLFKDPMTDSGLKRSARGMVAVIEVGGELTLIEEATRELVESEDNMLKIVFENGTAFGAYATTWEEVVNRVGVRTLK